MKQHELTMGAADALNDLARYVWEPMDFDRLTVRAGEIAQSENRSDLLRRDIERACREISPLHYSRYIETRLDTDRKLAMVGAMKLYGGSFVIALSECFIRADSDNLRRL